MQLKDYSCSKYTFSDSENKTGKAAPDLAGLNYFEGLFEICNYVLWVFDPYREPDKPISDAYSLSYYKWDTGMSHGSRMLNKGISSPEAYSKGAEPYIVHEFPSRLQFHP